MSSDHGFATKALHGGGPIRAEDGAPARPGGGHGRAREEVRSHAPPLYQSTAFPFPDIETGQRIFAGRAGGEEYIYTRLSNPTVRELERRIAALEVHGEPADGGPAEGGSGGEAPPDVDARFFSSGMAAISAAVLGVAGDGGRVVCQDGIYGSTVRQMENLRRFGIEVDFASPGDSGSLEATIGRGRPPALVHIETPANPLLQLTDIRAAARAAHDAGALLSVDATFASPALLRPLLWEADLSLHSTTKFISGHGVAAGGIVTGRRETIAELLGPVRTYFGGSADPFAAWLTLLGLSTLEVRIGRASATAAALADFLSGHAAVDRVHYPEPARLPEGQLAAGGPMVSFRVSGGEAAARRVADRLRVCTIAATLGTADTLIEHPWSMSHFVMSAERRRELGIGPGLLRVSVGLETEADILEDFGRALDDEVS